MKQTDLSPNKRFARLYQHKAIRPHLFPKSKTTRPVAFPPPPPGFSHPTNSRARLAARPMAGERARERLGAAGAAVGRVGFGPGALATPGAVHERSFVPGPERGRATWTEMELRFDSVQWHQFFFPSFGGLTKNGVFPKKGSLFFLQKH